MKLHLFNISNFLVDGGAMFGVVPKALWSRVYPSDGNNLVVLSLRSLIVDTGDRLILVDTGWGDKQDAKFFRHVYLHGGEGLVEGLAARGYSTDDVSDVILTHLHADHCGGGVLRSKSGSFFRLTFPNAIYHVSRSQWEWASRNNLREEDSFLEENIGPIGHSGHLNLVDEECELYQDLYLRIFYGHTPGLMLPVIKYEGRTLFYSGDLIPTAAHLPLVWNMSYDIEPLKTIDEKKQILNEALENNYILIFQHDESVECCTLQMTPKGVRAKSRSGFAEIAGST